MILSNNNYCLIVNIISGKLKSGGKINDRKKANIQM